VFDVGLQNLEYIGKVKMLQEWRIFSLIKMSVDLWF
jgi:hypothetical protein